MTKYFIYFRCGAHVYNHYLDCRDTDYYVCEDSISDVLALPGEKVKHLTPVLACHDRSIRVLRDSTLMYNVELPGNIKMRAKLFWRENSNVFYTLQVPLRVWRFFTMMEVKMETKCFTEQKMAKLGFYSLPGM